MHPRIGVEKKAAMRQLRELLPPTYSRIAAIGGVHAATVREIACRESWPKLDVTRNTVMRPFSPQQLMVYEAMLRAEATVSAASGDDAVLPQPANVPPDDIGMQIVTQMRVLLAGMQAGQFDKARADVLLAMMRFAERAGMLPAAADRFILDQEQQKRSDDELAGILARVDQRIVELARSYAERLVAEQSEAA